MHAHSKSFTYLLLFQKFLIFNFFFFHFKYQSQLTQFHIQYLHIQQSLQTFKKAEINHNQIVQQLQLGSINKYMSITNAKNQLNQAGTQRPQGDLQAQIQSPSSQILETMGRKSEALNTQGYQHSVEIIITEPKIRDRQQMYEEMEIKQKQNNEQRNLENEQNSKMEGKSNQCNSIQSNIININSSLENEEEEHKDNEDKTIKYNKKIKKVRRRRCNKHSTTPGRGNQIQEEISSYSNQFSESNQNLKIVSQDQMQNQFQPSHINSIICHLCDEPIIFATETICGHAFCEHCLTEYMLVSTCCPKCGIRIRDKRGASNKKIDEIVEQFCQHLGKQFLQELKERKQNRRKLKQERRITNIHAGLQVDVRDDDYIWKRARVLRTFNRISSENVRLKFLVVEYIENYKKQEFSVNCSRIAKAGYYTDREQIPRNALQLYLILEEEKRSISNKQRQMKLELIEKQRVKIQQSRLGQSMQMVDERKKNQSLNEKSKNQQQNFESKS